MTSQRFNFRRTTLISICLAAFLVGLGLARTKIYFSAWVIVPCFALFLVALQKKGPSLVVVVTLLGLAVGLWRGTAYMQWYSVYDQIFRRNVTIVGTADSDAIYGDKSQITFDLNHIHTISQPKVDLVGKIGVKGFGEPMVYKGNLVKVSGKLYPTRGSKQANISFATIKILQKNSSGIETTRRDFEAGMQSALPEPTASFGLGLLIGQRTTIPKEVSLQLAAVGLTHVVAVSGYNLTIIMRGVRRLLKKRSKYQSTLVSLLLIGTFLLFTGFSASIVRAAIVSVLSLWAWYYGRNFRPIVLILLAAAITAGFYPLYLWSDIGWYLSFLAFFGIMIIAPLITKRLFKRKEPKLLLSLVIETSCAQIMTMPIIMYIFGQFSVIALVANILVVPLVPLAMLMCLIAGLSGMLLPLVSGWFALPARIVLTYMLDVVSALSKLPKALVSQPLGLWQMLTLYTIVVALGIILWFKNRGSGGIIDQELVGESNVRTQQMVNHQAAEGRY